MRKKILKHTSRPSKFSVQETTNDSARAAPWRALTIYERQIEQDDLLALNRNWQAIKIRPAFGVRSISFRSGPLVWF
jgi:hypothetical protein